MLYQYALETPSGCIRSTLICWLEGPRLRNGTILTLKETGNKYWKVMASYNKVERSDIKHGWNNNI